MSNVIDFPIKNKKECGDPWCNTIPVTKGQLLEIIEEIERYRRLRSRLNNMTLFDRIFKWEFGDKCSLLTQEHNHG